MPFLPLSQQRQSKLNPQEQECGKVSIEPFLLISNKQKCDETNTKLTKNFQQCQ